MFTLDMMCTVIGKTKSDKNFRNLINSLGITVHVEIRSKKSE